MCLYSCDYLKHKNQKQSKNEQYVNHSARHLNQVILPDEKKIGKRLHNSQLVHYNLTAQNKQTNEQKVSLSIWTSQLRSKADGENNNNNNNNNNKNKQLTKTKQTQQQQQQNTKNKKTKNTAITTTTTKYSNNNNNKNTAITTTTTTTNTQTNKQTKPRA